MNEVSLFRLYLLRAMYLFIVVGLGVWHWELMEGQASCMLWLLLVPLPQWLAGRIEDSIKPSLFACSMVALVYIAIPWRYVFAHYIKARGDRWW